MGTFFINVGLVAGVTLAALPVILHLFLRQTPKHVLFPALRLVRERQKRSRKRLRIKNWLLLLARMALLALMALALARPRLWSNTTLGDQEVPTAMALIFDTSLSMEYKERDKPRLDEAKERARELLGRMHESSRVFVIDSSEPILPASVSPSAARKRIDGLTIHAVNRPLNTAVSRGYKAVAGADQPRREVFVFTDLARTSWDTMQPIEGVQGAAEARKDPHKPSASIYLVRLAPKEPHDVTITEAAPVAGFLAQGDTVPIRVVVRSSGPKVRRVVEFSIEGADGKMQKKGQQEVEVPADGEAVVRFTTPKLEPGLRRAEVRLSGEPDPLEKDDRRYITFDVPPPLKVLLVSDSAIDARFVEYALDPLDFRAGGGRPFPVTRIATGQFSSTVLKEYACVFLLNVADLPEADWGRLNTYVREGGSLVIGLGDRVQTDSYNAHAGALLPGSLGVLHVPKEAEFTFGKADLAHPIFSYKSRELLTELTAPPIYKYREVKPIGEARALLAYQNGEPALLERVFGGPRAGHVLLWTTSLSRLAGTSAEERQASWNDFPLSWSFFAVMNQTVPYLAGVAGRRLDYEAGEDAVLPIDPARHFTSFSIQAPGATNADRLSNPVAGAGLLVTAPPLLGPWTITASSNGNGAKSQPMGFSVNFPPGESQLQPLSEAELNGLFGGPAPEHYVLANDTLEDITHVVGKQRRGVELYPYFMAAILLVITLENLLANTFYREAPKAVAAPATHSRPAA